MTTTVAFSCSRLAVSRRWCWSDRRLAVETRTCSRGLSPSMQALRLLRQLLERHRAISSLDQRENRFLSTPSADAFAHWNVVRFAADSMDCRSFQQTGGFGCYESKTSTESN